MRRFTLILATGALLAGGASAEANNGKGGGTPPSYSNCSTDTAGYTTCTATNPAGRRCTQIFNPQGESIYYKCEKV